MIIKKEWKTPASSGEGMILSRSWLPQNPPVGLIQIVHGMAEYADRYDEFARYLAGAGFAVFANDHAGHGSEAKVKGYFAKKNGWQHVLNDCKRLNDEMHLQYPDKKLFLLGHSMGSFLARSYIARWNDLDGCIISGTMGKKAGLQFGIIFASLQKILLGAKSTAHLLCLLSFCQNNKRVKNPASIHSWVCSLEEVVTDYVNDPLCGFLFTAGGLYDMFSGIKEISSNGWAKKVPSDLSVYIFAGTEDPVGDYGAGPQQLYNRLKDAGLKDVSIKLYKGCRHECLKEFNKEEVFADSLKWLQDHL
ncbi:MAG: alpha/beta hydrolase [Termitinemataceae bacterium]|nr:MAG: alpha/beta hydrolase [Termitinemataceae bacterium]